MPFERLHTFLRPLYQDLDGADRLLDVERVSAIARKLHTPVAEEAPDFDLLLLLQGLGAWLSRVGNASRLLLAAGGEITESQLARVHRSIRRLEDPQTDAERALAAALLIDEGGVRGLAHRLAHARREGLTPLDVAREELMAPPQVPGWLPPDARRWLAERNAQRLRFCEAILEEAAGAPLSD